MPHVIYLHSQLQKDRLQDERELPTRHLLNYNKLDCLLGLGLAGVVNVAMLCVAAALFADVASGGHVSLSLVHSRLASVVGGGAALAFGARADRLRCLGLECRHLLGPDCDERLHELAHPRSCCAA